MSEKVSIILPVHNGEAYLHEAIDSVLAQTHSDWELIIVDDGSSDGTATILGSYKDERIKVFRQENKGVSAARNRGLQEMEGEFLLFLDADDVLYPRSLESRLNKFKGDPELSFVDGSVLLTGADSKDHRELWSPSFEGYPKEELLALKDTCFVTISWLICSDILEGERFDEGLTHCEDLDFFLSLADKGKYAFVREPVMKFRRSGRSAMSNIKGLEKGYRRLVHKTAESGNVDERFLKRMRSRAKRNMFRAYLKKGMFVSAFQSLWSWESGTGGFIKEEAR